MNSVVSGHFKRLQEERDMYKRAVVSERNLRIKEREVYDRRLKSKVMWLIHAVVDGLR